MEQYTSRYASITVFKKHLLKAIQPDPYPVYNIWKPIGLKLLTRLRLCLSHLNEHRFNQKFEPCVNPLCTCSLEAETTSHFFLCCHYYPMRLTLFNELYEIDMNLPSLCEDKFLNIILYGSSHFSGFKPLQWVNFLKCIMHNA